MHISITVYEGKVELLRGRYTPIWGYMKYRYVSNIGDIYVPNLCNSAGVMGRQSAARPALGDKIER